MINNKKHEVTLPAADWEPYLKKAKVRVSELEACKSERAKAIRIGKFLGPMVGRRVPIQHQGRTGTAELRLVEGRGREKRYGFVIRWDCDVASEDKKNRSATQNRNTRPPSPPPLKESNLPAEKSAKSGGPAQPKASRVVTNRTPSNAGGVIKSPPKSATGGGNQEKW